MIIGAPGFQPEANEYRLDADLQDRITRMLNEFEMFLSKFEMYQNLASLDMTYDERLLISNLNIRRNASHIIMEVGPCENKLERRRSL